MPEEIRPVFLKDDAVMMLDQRLLPAREVYLEFTTAQAVSDAIRDMVVRGAPAIGVAAAMGVAVSVPPSATGPEDFEKAFEEVCETIVAARPTAINLAWAVNRMRGVYEAHKAEGVPAIREALRRESQEVMDEDIRMNRAIGKHGGTLIPDGATVMTHCNAGALATGGYGTALGVVRGAREAGRKVKVFSSETRPYLQGARLTSWELVRDGFEVTLITDNAAGHLMASGAIDCIVVGSDRTAANGDVANKIGTYTHAVLAHRHNIPFYVAIPTSTLDMNCPDGSHIPIEERPAEEVLGFGGQRVAAEGVDVRNPAFDVTPWQLVTAIITERGVHRPGPDGFDFRD